MRTTATTATMPKIFTQRGVPGPGSRDGSDMALLRASRTPPPGSDAFAIHNVSLTTSCINHVTAYPADVPKLWDHTIDAHRQAVRAAVLDTTWELVAEHG